MNIYEVKEFLLWTIGINYGVLAIWFGVFYFAHVRARGQVKNAHNFIAANRRLKITKAPKLVSANYLPNSSGRWPRTGFTLPRHNLRPDL